MTFAWRGKGSRQSRLASRGSSTAPENRAPQHIEDIHNSSSGITTRLENVVYSLEASYYKLR